MIPCTCLCQAANLVVVPIGPNDFSPDGYSDD